MGTEKNSSKETRRRAKDLGKGELPRSTIFPFSSAQHLRMTGTK